MKIHAIVCNSCWSSLGLHHCCKTWNKEAVIFKCVCVCVCVCACVCACVHACVCCIKSLIQLQSKNKMITFTHVVYFCDSVVMLHSAENIKFFFFLILFLNLLTLLWNSSWINFWKRTPVWSLLSMEENTEISSLKVSFKDTSSEQHVVVGIIHTWWPDCDTVIPIWSVDSSQKEIVFNCWLWPLIQVSIFK